MKRAVHFGAGNIGRGFIAPTLQANNYQVTFIDVNTDVIKRINDEGSYTVTSLSIEGTTEQKVKDVNAVELNDTDTLNKILLDADIITTSVWPKFVKGVYEKITTLENQKDQIIVAFKKPHKNPLGPLVVRRIGSSHFSIPIEGKANIFQLLGVADNVLFSSNGWMLSCLNCILLCW